MPHNTLTDKQLLNRFRFLSDKLQSIWGELSPKLTEFDELTVEFNDICLEFEKRHPNETIA